MHRTIFKPKCLKMPMPALNSPLITHQEHYNNSICVFSAKAT